MRRKLLVGLRSSPGLMRRRNVPEHKAGRAAADRVEPPLRAAEHRLNQGPRGDARPQAGFKAGHILSEE